MGNLKTKLRLEVELGDNLSPLKDGLLRISKYLAGIAVEIEAIQDRYSSTPDDK